MIYGFASDDQKNLKFQITKAIENKKKHRYMYKQKWNIFGIGIGFIDILYHNVIIPNVYRSKTITWNTCCKKNKIN